MTLRAGARSRGKGGGEKCASNIQINRTPIGRFIPLNPRDGAQAALAENGNKKCGIEAASREIPDCCLKNMVGEEFLGVKELSRLMTRRVPRARPSFPSRSFTC
jgi:hypothetical protein